MERIRELLCFDLGGTRLKAGVVRDGRVHSFISRPTAGLDAEGALGAVVDVARELRSRHGPQAAGIGVPGIVEDGRIIALPGKFDGLAGRDVEAALSHELGLPVTAVNDALAYGVGESVHGSARGVERAVVVTVGTGVGVTVLEHGQPVARGPLGSGILGGHIPISDEDHGPVDTNGRRGTIEARCSAPALAHYARVSGFRDDADIPEIYAAAQAGDPAARDGVNEYRRWLTRAVVALAHAHTPGVVVLGGGPMPDGNPVVDGLRAEVRDRLWPGYSTEIAVATLGDEASLLGVAHLMTRKGSRR